MFDSENISGILTYRATKSVTYIDTNIWKKIMTRYRKLKNYLVF